MKKLSSVQWFLLTLALAAIIFSLALPGGNALAEEDDDKPLYITLTIINQSHTEFSLLLYGPDTYEITVPKRSEASYTIARGWYAFTMGSCDLSEVGTFDFNGSKTIHVPICGGTAGSVDNSGQHIDSSDYIRPATIKVRNRTQEYVEVYIRTLDEDHFMKFDPLETQYLLIEDASREFVYSYTACGKFYAGYTRLFVHVPFDLKCGP